MNIGKTIECSVRAEQLKRQALRLERMNSSGIADKLREGNRVGADIRSDVDRGVTRLQKRTQQARLLRGPFPIQRY